MKKIRNWAKISGKKEKAPQKKASLELYKHVCELKRPSMQPIHFTKIYLKSQNSNVP